MPRVTPIRFHLFARISSDAPKSVRAPLEQFLGATAEVRPSEDGFVVEADLEGGSARELNRTLLTVLRRAEKRTRLRAEWTTDGTTERFFDYVPKGVRTTSDRPATGRA